MMAMGIFLFILLLALLILLFLKQLWSRRHLPPGPLALPLIGTLWAHGFSLSEDYFRKPAKRYGNIYTMWAGSHLLVVLSGFRAVKEGMTGFSDGFSDRPNDPSLIAIGKGMGIILSNCLTWKHQRHIAVTSLRKLGLGKKSIEHQIEDVAQTLVGIFRQTKGQPFDPSIPVLNAVSNIICALSFGYQFAPEDKNFQELIQSLERIVKFTGTFFHLMFSEFPRLMKHLPGSHKEAMASAEFIRSFAKQEIEKHKEFHSLHEPQDFIDHYLLQMEKSGNDPDSTYNEENLAQCISDFFSAGSETSFITIMWALLLLTNRPDIQEKVQKEIEDVFGFSGSISYQDRKKLPYTNAVIHEMQRVKYVLLVGVPRQSTKDVKMRGYHIPKGAIIAADLHSVLLDPEQWETPEEFNPNHFLDKHGKFIEREEFLPFGIGERACVGEQLARIELFIFLASLLRSFSFRLPEGVKELNEEPVVKVVVHPHPYKLCAIPTQA
ncbi:cytochrome P450 2J5-like [Thamnophis elegans]|uniref:cytochrome P450 2J5-like n=1 Tax=Thamnophis elegans TaxID=35005 RepID=UPI0013767FE3|nr:cytochrome P450 2J5-like [Thamnophis elegans]